MAIEILSLRRESSAHDVLADVLKRAEPALLREGAAIALGRLGDPAGVAALAALVETAAQPDRRLVLAARLAELGSAGGYTHVKAAAAPDAPERSRVLAVGALVPFLPIESKANAVGATDLFLGLLKDESASVRREVLLYLPFAVEKGLALERVRPLAAKVARDDPDATVKESATLLIVAWDEQQHRASK